MSIFSAAFTRAKGAISGIVRVVPVVGGALGNAIEGIHTGDEHQDASGNWVSNATGEIVVKPPTQALQAEIDRVNAYNAEELRRLRQSAADSVARVGAGAAISAAAQIGPKGNIYQTALNTPVMLIGGVALLVLLLIVARKS